MEVVRGEEGKDREEWVSLILMAKQLGIKPDEVRNFIKKNSRVHTDKKLG